MSGHSKWSTIKRQKASTDAKRGQLFTKLSKEIMIAVQQGGGSNLETNFKLRLSVQKAKDSNMPTDTIDNAIKRASGNLDGEQLNEIIYEGYGPGGTAILVQCLTSNKNRTAAAVRSTFNKFSGNLGENGCVSWNFEHKGIIITTHSEKDLDETALIAIDCGADDVTIADGILEILSNPENLENIRDSLEKENFQIQSSEESMVPKSTISLKENTAETTLKLLDELEEIQDVQKVHSNADFPDNILAKYKNSQE